MWPFLGSLITGGAGLLGSLFSSNSNAQTNAQNVQAQMYANEQNMQLTREQNQINREYATFEAEKLRDWQSQMSNTGYQRSMQDMKAAGLNPAMMFGSGGPAPTPSGAMGQSTGTPARVEAPRRVADTSYAGLGDVAAKAVSSAVQVKTMDKMADEMANLQVENERLRKVTEQVAASTATERERTKNVSAQTENVKQDTLRQKLDRARQEFEAIKFIDLSGIPDSVRKAGNIGAWAGGKVGETVAPIASTASSVLKMLPKSSVKSRSYAPDGKSFDEYWSDRIKF